MIFGSMVPSTNCHAFFATGPVVSFRVADFETTRQRMDDAGVKFIVAVQTADGHSWQHYYCPDGTISELSGPAPSRQ
jgi:hypothetical protein